MNSKRQSILVMRPGTGSLPANTRIVDLIHEYFPEFEVVVVDIQPLIRRQRLTLLLNGIRTVQKYWRGLLTGTHKFRQCFWRTPYMHRAMRDLIRDRYGDMAWAFTFQIQSLFDGSIPGVPNFVYTDHTHLANLEYPSFDRRRLYHPDWIECEREIYVNASRVFVWSTNMIRTLVDRYRLEPERVLCVFAGANSPVPAQLPPPHPQATARRILFVGVDWQRKGGPDFLRAVASVRQRVPEVEAVVVSAFVPPAADCPPGVRFTGKVPLDEIAREFGQADVFCLPTYLEPFGIVFIEAMAYGLPIVSTKIGALPDLVDDGVNGLLVEPGDVSGLSRALAKIIEDDSLYRAMSNSARLRYDKQFNWQSIFTNIRQEISAAIQQERSGPAD